MATWCVAAEPKHVVFDLLSWGACLLYGIGGSDSSGAARTGKFSFSKLSKRYLFSPLLYRVFFFSLFEYFTSTGRFAILKEDEAYRNFM